MRRFAALLSAVQRQRHIFLEASMHRILTLWPLFASSLGPQTTCKCQVVGIVESPDKPCFSGTEIARSALNGGPTSVIADVH